MLIWGRIEERICTAGIEAGALTSQVIQRDRHAHYLSTLAILPLRWKKLPSKFVICSAPKVREAEEPFGGEQRGSSAMPHKRNPVVCEQISGLARLVRSNMIAAFENIGLWHERDISHSSVERIILPDSTILIDYMLAKMTTVVADMRVFPERMLRNLDATQGLVFSGQLLQDLVEKGMPRDDAYKAVQENAMVAWETDTSFRERVAKDSRITKFLDGKALEHTFDLVIRYVDATFARLRRKANEKSPRPKRRCDLNIIRRSTVAPLLFCFTAVAPPLQTELHRRPNSMVWYCAVVRDERLKQWLASSYVRLGDHQSQRLRGFNAQPPGN